MPVKPEGFGRDSDVFIWMRRLATSGIAQSSCP